MPDTEGRTRQGSRLEVDDEGHCKWCGKDISGVQEFFEAELCGSCKAEQFKRAAKAVASA